VELARRIGVLSGISVPLRQRDATVAVMTFITTADSGRRYDYYDVVIAEELARRSAALLDRARLLEQLAQAVNFRDRMMAILGHDLRNPLGAILVSAVRLREDSHFPASLGAVIERVERAARRISEMITTLLDFTKMRDRHLPVAIAPANLAEVSRAVIDELRTSHPDRSITLDLHGDARGLWDAARLGQVISNLVGNALTHGAAAEPVNVAIDADGDDVTLRVHNFGPAIAPALVPTIFEPFRRGREEPGDAKRGLGLGLFIVRQIVLAHAGEVRVESTAAAGTTFIVRLPRRPAGVTDQATEAPAPAP
jgi:signal transduction histidine kinase